MDQSDLVLTTRRLRGVILKTMDHIEVLREKIASLRDEIAQIKELNDQHRRPGNNAEAHIAHGQRLERLQQIQQELAQLAGPLAVGSYRSRREKKNTAPGCRLVKKASYRYIGPKNPSDRAFVRLDEVKSKTLARQLFMRVAKTFHA